jgi:ABC-type microcin C transport system duplicated ATPase subunit YejF
MSDELLRVNQLNVRFPVMSRGLLRRQTSDFHAVKDLSFHLNRGETLGIVVSLVPARPAWCGP